MGAISIAFLAAFVAAVTFAVLFAVRNGSFRGYVVFCWVFPVFGWIWSNFEFELNLGAINLPFVLILVYASGFVAVICSAVILVRSRRELSAMKRICLVVAAFVHGIPFWIFSILSITGTR